MLYLIIARSALRRATVYRSAFVAAIVTNAFFGALLSFSFIAVYAGRTSVAGLSLSDVLTYTWTTQALISLGLGWILHPEIAASIRSGEIVSDLTRPWSFLGYWMARSFGERAFNLLVRVPLTYAVGVAFFGARLPAWEIVPIFALALLLAMLIAFCISFMVQMSAFWLIDNSGVQLFANTMILFFSGFLLPLAYFPEPLIQIANWLPFRAMTDIPARIFLGTLSGPELLASLAQQVAWLLLILPLAAWLVQAAIRKLEVQGG